MDTMPCTEIMVLSKHIRILVQGCELMRCRMFCISSDSKAAYSSRFSFFMMSGAMYFVSFVWMTVV